MYLDTAGNIVNKALGEVGIAASADPYASTDPLFIQARQLLETLVQEVWRMREWTHLTKEATFITVAGTATYAFPADFGALINQSGWNRTNRLPLGGPLSAQEWQYLKARLAGVVFTVLFRQLRGQIFLYPDGAVGSSNPTPGGYTIAYEYVSRWTAQPVGQTAPTIAFPTASTDTIWFDPLLLQKGLKAKFLLEKGFPTAANAVAEYENALELVKGDDSSAKTIRLDRQGWSEPLIGDQNIPVTGFGSG